MNQESMLDTHLRDVQDELLTDAPMYHFEMARRDFLKTLGGGILVFLVAPDVLAQRRDQGNDTPDELGAWLHIGEDGTVTVYTGKVEVGQNARTSLTQVVAEELPVPLASIQLVMGDTDLTPYDRGTFGSRTTPTMAPQLRRAAATARELLISLAAEKWNVERDSITIAEGQVWHTNSGRSVSLGELTQAQELTADIAEDVPTKRASDWQTAGTSVSKVNARNIVTGKHRYPSDIKRPGMLYGKMLRPPAFSAKLVSLDTSQAEAMHGVSLVRDDDFIGVVAETELTATRAVEAIQAEWEWPEQPSNENLLDHFRSHVEGDNAGRSREDIRAALDAADVTREATYTIAYIAHTPLEPRAAVAEWNGNKLTVWTGTQRPFGVHEELTGAFGMPPERVRVIMPDTGSGYGGKHTGDAAIEAARLAREVGKPVKLVWTREEEFTWTYFRPAALIEVQSGATADGTLTTWEFHNYNSGGAALATPYEVPNQQVEYHRTNSPLRQGSYRALAATANIFARESHMDELARALNMDPLEFRLKNLKNERLRDVFNAAAERFGWAERDRTASRGYGIAGATEKGGYIATCVEVKTDGEDIEIVRVVAAFECGAVTNPDQLTNQVEGCIIMGLGGALFESIQFRNGQILNPRLSAYRVPHFGDIPPIETVLLDRKDLPSAGGGETPITGIAPALANAIFDATGIRHRSLPMGLSAKKG